MNDINLERKLQRIDIALGMNAHRVDMYSWEDENNVCYRYDPEVNSLIVYGRQSIDPTIIEQINALPAGVNAEFWTGLDSLNVAGLNSLLQALSYGKCNKNVIIDMVDMAIKNKDDFSFDNLPSNVKISNTGHCTESYPYFGMNNFDTWLLNIEESRFYDLVEKLSPVSKKRALALHNIVYSFYDKYADVLGKLSDKEKCDFVYAWLRKNTRFAGENVRMLDGIPVPSCGEVSDPIETYRTGKGVCSGRSRLFKALLNNRYLNINCFLVTGTFGNTGHEWCEVYFDDGTRLYYDANLPLSDPTKLTAAYSIRDDNDARRNGFGVVDDEPLSLRERSHGNRSDSPTRPSNVPPLPPRVPPLPPRNVPPLPSRNVPPLPSRVPPLPARNVPPLPSRVPPLPPKNVPPLPSRNKEKIKIIPPLPKRRDN